MEGKVKMHTGRHQRGTAESLSGGADKERRKIQINIQHQQQEKKPDVPIMTADIKIDCTKKNTLVISKITNLCLQLFICLVF